MTVIIMIVTASGLVMSSAMVLIQCYLVKLRREFNEKMQSQAGKFDCTLAILSELSRTQNDSRILLSNIEGHLRSITENESKERLFGPAGI